MGKDTTAIVINDAGYKLGKERPFFTLARNPQIQKRILRFRKDKKAEKTKNRID